MLDQLIRSVNLRDLGGARAGGGRTVRRGQIYRSAALADLAGDLLAAVRALGIHTVIDLRYNKERAAQPTPWEAIGCTGYWSRDHHDSGADLGPRLRNPALRAEDSRAAMIELYAELPYAQAEAYSRLFRAVAAGDMPVLFHCAVGKDRTGVAAALILEALEVPRDVILADYLRTAEFDLLGSPHIRVGSLLGEDRMAALAPVLRVEAEYLDTMFAAVIARSGSIEAYLAETLGLSEDERQAFRTAMIEAD